MTGFKQMKTAKLGIVVQVTEIHPGKSADRLFEVHDVERNRGFRVSVPAQTLREKPPNEKKSPLNWSDADVEGAIGLAIERFLRASPELLAGPKYEVQVTAEELYEYWKLRST
jgi:hypothetical protein